MINLEDIKIEFPSISEIDQILDIQNLLLLEKRDKKTVGEQGFLINEINKNEFINAVNRNCKDSFFIVAKDLNNVIVGYFLVYDMGFFLKCNIDWFLKTGVNPKILENKRTLYGRHIVSNGYIKGVGKLLNQYMFNLIKDFDYSFYIGEICEGPVSNDISLGLHKDKLCMQKITEYNDVNNFTWGVYYKTL